MCIKLDIDISINPFKTNGVSHIDGLIKLMLGGPLYILSGHRLKFKKNIVHIFFPLKIDFGLIVGNVMPYFIWGQQCLPKNP